MLTMGTAFPLEMTPGTGDAKNMTKISISPKKAGGSCQYWS